MSVGHWQQYGGYEWLFNVVRQFVLAFLLLAIPASSLAASSVSAPHIRVSLLSELDAISSGGENWFGLLFEPDPDWHVYWKNPGDSGLPPTLDWQQSRGIASVGEFLWPNPDAIPVRILMNYGYKSVLLMFPVSLEQGRQDAAELALDVSWLVCKEDCIPGSGTLSLSLPTGHGQATPAAPLFEKTRAQIPAELPALGGSWSLDGDRVELEFYASRPVFDGIAELQAFPASPDVVDYSQAFGLNWRRNRLVISAVRNTYYQGYQGAMEWLLVAPGKKSWTIRVPHNSD